MKIEKLLFIPALVCAMLLSACSSSQKSTLATNVKSVNEKSVTGKKWKLIELNGKAVANKINNKEPFILLQLTDHRYSASGGCNGMGGTFTISPNGKIKFSQGMSTMMMCPDMSAEDGLKKMFSGADNYTMTENGDTLSLNKGRRISLARFITANDDAGYQNLNGTWEVDYISGIKIAFQGLYPDKKPVITFNLSDRSASGNSSCNNYRMTFSIDGNNIQFSDPVSTKMACEGEGESNFFNTLKKINKYSINGNTLNLIMDDIVLMTLQKK